MFAIPSIQNDRTCERERKNLIEEEEEDEEQMSEDETETKSTHESK
jgi:hypothetical protein